MLIAFDDTKFAVEVPEQQDFLDALRGAAGSWTFAPGSGQPLASVRMRGPKYRLVSADGEVETTAVGAACGAVAEVVEGYVAENPSRLCLHCGAVEFSGRLVVFPSAYRAGKSTLVAQLAATGYRVFGDDVLPLSDDDASGIALGLAPRLRLPMPDNASDAFRDFVRAHAGPGDGYYQYLSLPPPLHAPRGDKLPLGAIVLLDRRAEGTASLSFTSRSRALQALITRNFARAAPAGELLDRLHNLMGRLPLLTLHYSDLDEAAALLGEVFSAWPARLDGIAPARLDVLTDREDETDPLPVDLTGLRLRQNPAVTLRTEDGELFLADATGTSIHHLNQVGAGLWNLLAEPVTEAEAIEILSGAFPETNPAAVKRDVQALFSALLLGHFILVADGKR